uniref:Potassium channel domain-containing protein n=1 Tax=Caenorhabditis japonica TaxID=281687 RepID=A0A8R1HIG3_CAEJA
MHNFEEERPTTLVASIKESARSSKRKIKYYCSFILNPIKKLIISFKLLIIIGLYSFAGAHLFMYLEVPSDLQAKEDGFHQRKIAREVMVLNLRAIFYDNREDREERWKHAILKFEADMGLDEPALETVWTFWMSFLYAGTIFTTIGYGNIACKTRSGQIATMIYAFAGIPIMLVMLSSLNNFLLKWIKIITNWFCDILLYIGVRLGITAIRQDEGQKIARYKSIAAKMKKWRISRREIDVISRNSEEDFLNTNTNPEANREIEREREKDEEDEEDEVEPDPPVFSTLFATVSWIMLSAAVFCLFEDWAFFTSFYFCFISLTTIGLGDVTPANPEYMIATFGVVIIGLSMLTVCIDVIKEKLALMYMALLRKLLKDYMEAVKRGDSKAASAMMAGFQGKAKFLMPLISKKEGTKVMDKFKQDCSKRGIDPPPVLTNIDPETGMPAFANASKGEFNDYIEEAEERFAEEQKRIAQTPLSKSTDLLQSAPPQRVPVSVGTTQTAPPLPRITLEVQAGTTMGKFHDYGSQTQQESSDEGIQTDLDWETEKAKMRSEPVMADAGTQYEIVLLASIGIQPEVSSIYHGVEFDGYSSETSYEESGCESEGDDHPESPRQYDSDASEDFKDNTFLSQETPLPFEVADPGALAFGLKSPPIEITPFTDDESAANEANEATSSPSNSKSTKLKPYKVEKSASMDSTDTVIHLQQREEREKEDKEKDKDKDQKRSDINRTRKKKRKRSPRKTREHELRFLKNVGNQICPILIDCATQYEISTIESGSQYDQKGRSRKCQTKLSSINHEQLQGIRETVQKLRRRESEMSRVTNVSESDWEMSSRASESGRETEVAEISLDLSLIALGVDETGKVVDIPTLQTATSRIKEKSEKQDNLPMKNNTPSVSISVRSESTSVDKVTLEDEDENEEVESLEELELYTTDFGSQTEEKTMVDRQEYTTPRMLDVTRNCTTQTTFSTFHLPQKVYESASTSSDEEDKKDLEKENDDKTKKPISEVYFMTNTGCQTQQTSFHVNDRETKIAENEHQETSTEEEIPHFLIDSVCQTVSSGQQECSTSTEEVRFADDIDTLDGATQTITVNSLDSEIQTTSQNYTEATIQTAPPPSPSIQATECQTDLETLETDSQTDSISTIPVQCQTETDFVSEDEKTEKPTYSEAEVQVALSTKPEATEQQSQTDWKVVVSESQTEKVEVDSIEMQTELTKTMITETQTEQISVNDSEIQTEEKSILTSSMQTDTPSNKLQYSQTDAVLFVGDIPQIDNAAQSEPPDVSDSSTQHVTSTLDVDIQVKPISFDTQTQHSIDIDAKSCQTELVTMKSRKSQDEDEESTLLVKVDTESQASSINLSPIQIDIAKTRNSDGDNLRNKATSSQHGTVPLWSDFDPVLDDEDILDGETQTEEESEQEEAEGSSKKTKSKTTLATTEGLPDDQAAGPSNLKFNMENVEKSKVEMSTSTVQATTEMCEQSAGVIGEDDWLQVYVQELDEERRLRMSDIGIQTGVLARVQHMYTRPISDAVEATSSAPITLRKSSDSSEPISTKTAKSSEESLAPSASGTALSVSESMDDHLWAERASPFSSRQGSMKRGRSSQDAEKKADKSNIVQDLRAKFEMKSPTPPKSPNDGQGSSKSFFQ